MNNDCTYPVQNDDDCTYPVKNVVFVGAGKTEVLQILLKDYCESKIYAKSADVQSYFFRV